MISIQKNKKLILAGTIGTAMEIYDLSVYGYMAIFISSNFFSNLSSSLALINAFAIFLIGFVTRPLGAIVFGLIGDYFGRKQALLISIFLMSIATAMVGILPTYHTAGYISVFLLISARLFQGISVGGEYIGSVIYLFETAPQGKKIFFSSFAMVGSNLGILTASGICLFFTKILSTQQMLNYGWRLPFILALLSGIGGFFIRSMITESKEFTEAKLSRKHYVNQKTASIKPFYLSLLLTCIGTITTYIVYIYMPTYLHVYQKINLKTALTINTLSIILLVLCTPIFGYASEQLKKNLIFYIGLSGISIFIIPYIITLLSHNLILITSIQCLITFFCACYFSTAPALIVGMFQIHTRYRLASFSYNLAATLFGGTIPLACSLLIQITGNFLLMGLLPVFFTFLMSIAFFKPVNIKQAK